MNIKIFTISYSIIFVFFAMHSLQPTFNIMSETFNVSMSKIAYVNTIMFIPLCLAPILYGYMLEHFKAKYIMSFSLMAISFFGFLMTLSTEYEYLLIFRFLQSLFFPAAITVTLTLLSKIDTTNIKKYMGIYISSTVFGGLAGRIFGGWFSDIVSWQMMFSIICIANFIGALLYFFIKEDSEPDKIRISAKEVFTILKDTRYLSVYLCLMLIYFLLAGMLNVLPFRAKELSENINETIIGFLYSGFLVGIFMPIITKKIQILHNNILGITIFTAICFFSIFGFLIPSIITLFIFMFVFCGGIFGAHNLATIYINNISHEKKGFTNGFYISFYYLGGVIGGQVPVTIYQYSDFNWAMSSLVFVALIAFLIIFRLYRNTDIVSS